MKHNHLLDKVIYTGTSSLLLFMIVLGLVLSSSSVSAVCTTDSSTGVVSCSETKNASVTVSLACTLSATVDSAHTATIEPGTVRGLGNAGGVNGIGQTTIKASCNDSGGYAIYAIGYTGDTYGTTTLVGNNTGETIATGTSTSGNASNWAMQINSVSGTYAPVVQNSFDSSSYHVVPDTFTMVAKRESATDAGVSAEGSKITATYGAYIAGTQLADTYIGKVKYTMVHPYDATAPTPPTLYDFIADMSKGTQTAADLQATITTPTSTNPSEDTSNSGVFEYNPSVFGIASDASNDYTIYYYRGILETNPGTYGSAGSASAYPNYVKLSNNTCWRIVRTTGSGGVKMIYNGTWSSNTCAKSQDDAQVTTQVFAAKGTSAQSYWYSNIHYVGYTFNNGMTDLTTATSVDTVFGSDANPALNNTRSNIKTYIEDTWYANNMTAFTNMLESSAGYCNDRTAYSNQATSTALTTIVPYKTSSATMYFGAYGRNMNSAKTPSLNCPRNTVDLYRYVANSNGLSNELKYPVALLTADEASFAGSGSSTATNGSSYSAQSYLRSGSIFWLLSPYYRYSDGLALGFLLGSLGSLGTYRVSYSVGVRPAISLTHSATPSSGSGTATDPWVIEAQ